MTEQRPMVVVVGGGFAGLRLVKSLKNVPVDVTLIDHRNHHVFQPLLYQVATASLNPSEIAAPLRRILRKQKNVTVLLGRATRVDLTRKTLILSDGSIEYDFLVIAAGVTHSYFGHDDWSPKAPGLKSIQDALRMREKILVAFEAAEREPDARLREQWLTFVIVGGGPTGVELAGALAEIARRSVPRDFRRSDPRKARIVLVEATDRLLPTLSPKLSEKAKQQLQRLGVEVRTSSLVTDVEDYAVVLGAERIESACVLWAAGVKAVPLMRDLGLPVDRAGRVLVLPDMTIQGHQQVFVIGDLASLEIDGKAVPGVAPAAMQEGSHTAINIARRIKGSDYLPFVYRDRGTLATVGRGKAVAALRRVEISGFGAWLAWLGVHIFFLIGFRNRFVVLLEWARAFFTYERQARLITDDLEEVLPPASSSHPS